MSQMDEVYDLLDDLKEWAEMGMDNTPQYQAVQEEAVDRVYDSLESVNEALAKEFENLVNTGRYSGAEAFLSVQSKKHDLGTGGL